MELSSAFSSQGSIYQLVDMYMKIEEIPRDRLIEQKTTLSDKKKIYSKLDSLMSALKTKLDYLTDPVSDRFSAKTSSSSDPDVLGISAGYSAVNGNHALTVSRLASSDTRVSQQYNNSESSFTGFGGDQTFSIEVAHPTDEDPDNRISIDITVEAAAFSGTNDEVLKAISDAINDAMAQAVIDEVIENDEIVHSSVVNEQSGTSRIILGSELTGYANRMDFGASGLLDALGVNAATATSGTSGGYVTYIGTSVTDSELNSQFTMDGLTFYRDSNTVNDVLSGVTFKLLDIFDQPETVTVDTDTEKVKADVKELIDKYNEVVKYLRENTRVNSDTKTRGVLSTDLIYSGMSSDLRSIVMGSVSTTTSSDFKLLYNIGIESNQDGTLTIKDADKFTKALETKPLYVSDLFNTEDGIATRLVNYIDAFVKTGGTIDNSKKQLDNETQNLQDRIKYMNELLDKKEKRYFEDFTKLQETMYILQNQQSFFNSFLSGSY